MIAVAVHELHPALLEHLGLVDALGRRCEEVSAESGVTVTLDVTSELGPVPDEVALCLYRVAQEALRNVVNHAQARSARVELSRQNGRVAMRITDDGRGFEPGMAASHRGLGLIVWTSGSRCSRGRWPLRAHLTSERPCR